MLQSFIPLLLQHICHCISYFMPGETFNVGPKILWNWVEMCCFHIANCLNLSSQKY